MKKPQNTVPAGEFKAKCLQLMDRVKRTHQSLVITKRGKPVAKLVPLDEEPQKIFGVMHGTATIAGDIVEPLDDEWEVLT